jgi:hypothetical protein
VFEQSGLSDQWEVLRNRQNGSILHSTANSQRMQHNEEEISSCCPINVDIYPLKMIINKKQLTQKTNPSMSI